MADFVTIEKGLGPEGRIAVVRFDRGDGINVLSPEALRQLTDAAGAPRTTAKPRSWCDGGTKALNAGIDLKDAEGGSRRTMDIGSVASDPKPDHG